MHPYIYNSLCGYDVKGGQHRARSGRIHHSAARRVQRSSTRHAAAHRCARHRRFTVDLKAGADASGPAGRLPLDAEGLLFVNVITTCRKVCTSSASHACKSTWVSRSLAVVASDRTRLAATGCAQVRSIGKQRSAHFCGPCGHTTHANMHVQLDSDRPAFRPEAQPLSSRSVRSARKRGSSADCKGVTRGATVGGSCMLRAAQRQGWNLQLVGWC